MKKCRIWSNKEQKYLEPFTYPNGHSDLWINCEDGLVYDIQTNFDDDGYCELLAKVINETVIEQFTGLNDHTKWSDLSEKELLEWIRKGKKKQEWKGKEIFAGDILEYTSTNPFSLGQVRQLEVIDGHGRYWCQAKGIGISLSELLSDEQCKIIGNVNENKELLNKNNV